MDNLFSTDWIKDFESRIETALFHSTETTDGLPAWRVAAQPHAKKKSNCHLFICCNYNPESRVNHPAADYKTAVFNLYRFIKDSGPVVNNWWKICQGDPRSPKKRDFEKCREKIDLLRAVLAHNNSPENGLYEAEQLASYQKWCMDTIGKKSPASDNDYRTLLNEVIHMNDLICDYLEGGFKHLQTLNSQMQQERFRDWEDAIIDYFISTGVKANIFNGFLVAEYCRCHNIDNPRNKRELNRFFDDAIYWIHEQYFHTEQIEKLQGYLKIKGTDKKLINQKIAELQNERNLWERKAKELLSSESPAYEEIYKKMTALCEVDFFQNGLSVFWDVQRNSGRPLMSMLPGNLLPQYINYKLNQPGVRIPI